MGGASYNDDDPIELSRESVVAMLQEIVQRSSHDSPLSTSTLHAVVNAQNGDMYKCVDVILDMLNDPLTSGAVEARCGAGMAALERERSLIPVGDPMSSDVAARIATEEAAMHSQIASCRAARRARLMESMRGAPEDAVEGLVSAVGELIKSARMQRELSSPRVAEEASHEVSNVILSVDKTSAMPGDSVTVSVQYQEPQTPDDWVALVKASRPVDTRSYYVHQKVPAGGGTLKFTLPAKLGMCEFRVYRGSGYGILAGRSPLLRVGPDADLSVHIDTENRSATVQWRQLQGAPSSWSYLALVRADEVDNANYLAHAYLKAAVSGSTTLQPLPRSPGDYVVRFIPSGAGKSHTAQSAAFSVRNEDVVRAEVDDESGEIIATIKLPSLEPHARNWVAVAPADAEPHKYVGSYQYLPVEAEGTAVQVRFPAPSAKGSYVVRVYPCGSYKPHQESSQVAV